MFLKVSEDRIVNSEHVTDVRIEKRVFDSKSNFVTTVFLTRATSAGDGDEELYFYGKDEAKRVWKLFEALAVIRTIEESEETKPQNLKV